MKIGWQCNEIISSLICTAQKRLNDKVIVVNNILKRVCKLNELEFYDNSNICAENLFDDGKVNLANNFIYVLNRFILWNEKIYNGTSENDFVIKANFYIDDDESSNISNSSKVKESYFSICDNVVWNPDLRALRKKNLKVPWCRFENLPRCLCSYKNNTRNISYS